MAPIPDSVYFPALEKCLEGGQLLISWREALVALEGHRGEDHERLEELLLENSVQTILARPFDPFPSPTAQTKSAFETRTAAINVTPSADGTYNIDEIKEDTLWLSKETKVDELSALRVVVLEYQSRSRTQLLCDFSAEEKASLQEASGKTNTETSNLVPQILLKDVAVSGEEVTPFHSQSSRRRRTIRLYLSERRHILKCAQFLLHASLSSEDLNQTIKGKGKATDPSLRTRVGAALVTKIKASDPTFNTYIETCTNALQKVCASLETGSGWMKDAQMQELVEIDWFHNQVVEMILTMELILWLLEVDKDDLKRKDATAVRTSSVVLGWFKLVASYSFFDNFDPPFLTVRPLVSSLQSLVATISLALIDPWSASGYFDDRDPGHEDVESIPYVLDLDSIAELNSILLDAASALSPIASPAVFAWSIILREVRTTSVSRREARELRQSQRAIDGMESVSPGEEQSEPNAALLRRRNSASSEISHEVGIHDKIMEVIMDTPLEDDPVEHLARCAVDGSKVFDILTTLASSGPALSSVSRSKTRLIILDCVRCTLSLLGYIPEVATTVLAALVGDQQFSDLENEQPFNTNVDPIAAFCMDDILREFFLGSAISRYPYESPPFLKLARAIAACQTLDFGGEGGGPVLLTWLNTLQSFTYELPQDFRDYETTQEEENTNTIILTEPVSLFEPRGNKPLSFRERAIDNSSAFVIPAGTTGRILSDSGPKIALWFHEISGLRYLGKLLETALTAGEYFDAITHQSADRDSLIEIVGIFATLILTSNRIERTQSGRLDSQGPTHRILEEASDGLSRNRDIVSVIFNLFEEELQRQADGSDESLALLVTCTQFIYSLVPILPGRVWPLLGRSGLLDINGRGGRLAKVFTGVELVSCRYDFLIACTKLFDALVEDSAANAVARKSRSKTMLRFGSAEDIGTGVPSHILSSVLSSFTRAISEAFVSSCNWRYADTDQRLILSKLTSTVLEKILRYTHSIDDLSDLPSKLTGALAPAADYIVQTFLSTSSGHLRFQPFLRAFLDGYSSPESTSQAFKPQFWRQHVNSVLQFATTLIQISSLTARPSTQIEAQLFRASPLIARLYAVHETYQDSVVKLLDALVVSAAAGESEPPSLLGFLGAQTAKNFLGMLADLGKPLDDDFHTISIWRLMSSVVSNRQQWFSIYLLTGRTPRASLEKKTTDEAVAATKRTLLKVALDSLLHIETMSFPRTIAMLEFVSLAQNFWPWAMGDLQKSPEFINAISSYVSKIEPVAASAKSERCIEGCYQARIAALIAEVLAMYLYHRRQLEDGKAAEDVLTHISYYTRCAVSVPMYNSSLHGNLKRNFEARFPECTLQNFKRTQLAVREPGRGYYYDIQTADRMLGSDQGWTGKKNDGLAEELISANVNLSLVEAQVAVLHSWHMLATELSGSVKPSEGLQRVLARAINDCLVANNRAQFPENIFAQLNQTRADLALTLTQRLVETKSTIEECLTILGKVWDTISHFDSSFEMALASDDTRDITYYRTLLKILFLALHFQSGVQETETLPDAKGLSKEASRKAGERIAKTSARTQLLLEIINKIVFYGFRDIARAIHERPGTSEPEDVALITGILQASLNIPGMEFSHSQILIAMTASDVARVATNLFSWSDKLAVEGDPIFGELSMLFLLELSSVPAVAEQLALDGVLGHISSASITSYLRRPNISPFADSVGPQRCYAIWVRAILPFLLNLLDAVGSSIAAEVAIFLNQFPNLLANSVEAINTPSSTLRSERKTKHLCYSIVQEISCLSLIAFVLSRFRDGLKGVIDVPEVKWDAVDVRESVEWWLGSRAVLRDRIVPLGGREVAWAKAKPSGGGTARSRLEEVVAAELESVREVLNGGGS